MIFSSNFSFCLLSSFSLSLKTREKWSQEGNKTTNITGLEAGTSQAFVVRTVLQVEVPVSHVLSLLHVEQVLALHGLFQQGPVLQHQRLDLVQ